MNKPQLYLDMMLVYAICVVVDEAIRDVQYALENPDELNLPISPVEKYSRQYSFSDPTLLLKQRHRLDRHILRRIFGATS